MTPTDNTIPEEFGQVHISLPSGGTARVAFPPSSELVEALDEMVKLAKEMPIDESNNQHQ